MDEAERFFADNWVKGGQELVGINIRASSRWYTKNWPPSYIAGLCDRLAKEFNIRVVLTGASQDSEIAGYITKLTKSKPIVAVGKTSLMALAALIKHFKIYLTPDSAPMHIASAMGTPFIALFGPTDPRRHVASSKDCIVICKSDEVACSPCYSPTCLKNFKCMKKITVDEVLDAMRPYLTKERVLDKSPSVNNAS
jgi:ADP-heptose:LPS heptosyltransferase